MELFKQEGDTPRTIRAYVDHSGDVVLGSQDFPSEAMRGFVGGAREYEYWTQVSAAARDQLLIALLVERYQGNPNSVEEFRDWCQARGIPHEFTTWGSGQFD